MNGLSNLDETYSECSVAPAHEWPYKILQIKGQGHNRRRRMHPRRFWGIEVNFYPRDAMLARYLLSSSVCLSVRSSHAGIVSKRLNVGSRK